MRSIERRPKFLAGNPALPITSAGRFWPLGPVGIQFSPMRGFKPTIWVGARPPVVHRVIMFT
jgi:hypothetical protein